MPRPATQYIQPSVRAHFALNANINVRITARIFEGALQYQVETPFLFVAANVVISEWIGEVLSDAPTEPSLNAARAYLESLTPPQINRDGSVNDPLEALTH